MRSNSIYAFLILAIFLFPYSAKAITAKEVLEAVAKQNFGEPLRASLVVKSTKGHKTLADHVMWLMGVPSKDGGKFFIEFDEPKESKGIRFLFEISRGSDPKAFMYLPSTGKTIPIATEDKSLDLGGTGLTMEDLQGFVPEDPEKASIVKEEKAEGRDCYVIQVPVPGSGERMLWVSKNDYLVVKSQHKDNQGKVKRSFKVIEFFKTEKGKEFPREEEIQVPDKNIKIKVRQDNAVFGVALPDEIMDPTKFGTYSWKH